MISYTPIIQNLINESSYQLDLLRLDLIDKEISGNKWFKLKRNLEKAKTENFKTIVTFGGAFSNHIAATASACKTYDLNCVGIIRGEEKDALNPTLLRAKEQGMVLHFVSREVYTQKDEDQFKKSLAATVGEHYLIPEGGNNEEGIIGCTEILRPEWNYDFVFCACGTGTTYAGLLTNKQAKQNIVGISVLKGENTLPSDTTKILQSLFKREIRIAGNEALQTDLLERDCILNTYAFKGYAKQDQVLLDFKKEFESTYNIPLDHIYTTKLMYAVFDLVEKNKLRPGSKLLAIHSGGLQGNKGFEERYHLTPSL